MLLIQKSHDQKILFSLVWAFLESVLACKFNLVLLLKHAFAISKSDIYEIY